MKKKDMILIAAVLAISLISFAAIKMTQKDGKEVIVTVEGKEVYKTVKTRSVQTIKQSRNQEKRSYVCHIK